MNTLPAMMTVAQLAALYKKLTAYSMLENALVQNLSGLPSQNFLLVMAKVRTTGRQDLAKLQGINSASISPKLLNNMLDQEF